MGVVCLFVVPKENIKNIAFWAILYGAVGDLIAIIVTGYIFKAGGFINYGPFNFNGIAFFPIFAWSIFFIIYLYLLPVKKKWAYLFATFAAGYSLMFSHVLQNLGIMKWTYSQIMYPLSLYLVWHFSVTYTYNRFFRSADVYKVK